MRIFLISVGGLLLASWLLFTPSRCATCERRRQQILDLFRFGRTPPTAGEPKPEDSGAEPLFV